MLTYVMAPKAQAKTTDVERDRCTGAWEPVKW
jgi:hypothetical protein